MSDAELRVKLIEELQRIPDDKLTQIYDLIHHLRVESETRDRSLETMQFAGCWADLPDPIYAEFLEDLPTRRQQAFSQRRNRETSLD